MRQDNLALAALLKGFLAFWMVDAESADMRGLAGQVLGLHATKGHCRANDGLLVRIGEIGASQDDAREYHPRVWRIWADLGDLSLGDCILEPVGLDDGNHGGLGLDIFLKVDRIGYDVSGVLYPDSAFSVGREGRRAVFCCDLVELPCDFQSGWEFQCYQMSMDIPLQSFRLKESYCEQKQGRRSPARASSSKGMGLPSWWRFTISTRLGANPLT